MIEKVVSKKLIYALVTTIITVIVIICACLYKNNKVNISWDESYPDYKLEYILPTNIELGLIIDNEDELNKVKYYVTCGTINTLDNKIIWNLKNTEGECTLTASIDKEQISKKYTILPFDNDDSNLEFDYEIDANSDEDLDHDKLSNKQESKYKTNPLMADTDMDNLDDEYEISTSKTDPNSSDTDNDGLSDYDEIQLSLDPLKESSKNDGIKDGDRKLTYTITENNITLSITGKGNIANNLIQIKTNTNISEKNGLINKLYTFHTEGNMEYAEVTIPYTDEEISIYNMTEDNLSIYYYNIMDNKYEKIDTIVNKEQNILTAKLKHFSNYVIGDSSILNTKNKSEILFVIDNSWSMYSNEQYKKITGEEYYPPEAILDASDIKGTRFELTKEIVGKLINKNNEIGLAEFRADYKTANKIGAEYSEIKESLENMNGNFITKNAGTNISNALTSGMKNFSSKNTEKYIVILTDGQDEYLKKNINSIIETAQKNNIKICAIGFGEGENNEELSKISTSTGCKFYSSKDTNALSELFENLNVELNNGLVDIDEDGIEDGILIADSGFVVDRDGFSFRNFTSNKITAHCYGMSLFAELYYTKLLPMESNPITSGDSTSYAYNLQNSHFSSYNNLYDFKLKSENLKSIFGFSYFGIEQPKDLTTIENRKKMYSKAYRDEIINSDLFEVSEKKANNELYDSVENYILNEDKMQDSDLEDVEIQLFNAIYALAIKQESTNYVASGSHWAINLNYLLGDRIEKINGPLFIEILTNRLKNGDPVQISTLSHAVNAINLIQDIENPNIYYIGVYDNNYPGQKRYRKLKCNKYFCETQANKYYEESNEVLRITTSLEEDMKYFKNA